MTRRYATRRERDQDQLEFSFTYHDAHDRAAAINAHLFALIGDVLLTITPKPSPAVYARIDGLRGWNGAQLDLFAAYVRQQTISEIRERMAL